MYPAVMHGSSVEFDGKYGRRHVHRLWLPRALRTVTLLQRRQSICYLFSERLILWLSICTDACDPETTQFSCGSPPMSKLEVQTLQFGTSKLWWLQNITLLIFLCCLVQLQSPAITMPVHIWLLIIYHGMHQVIVVQQPQNNTAVPQKVGGHLLSSRRRRFFFPGIHTLRDNDQSQPFNHV